MQKKNFSKQTESWLEVCGKETNLYTKCKDLESLDYWDLGKQINILHRIGVFHKIVGTDSIHIFVHLKILWLKMIFKIY